MVGHLARASGRGAGLNGCGHVGHADTDVHIRQQRMIFPLVGIVIAGVCLIAGTAGRWFYPK